MCPYFPDVFPVVVLSGLWGRVSAEERLWCGDVWKPLPPTDGTHCAMCLGTYWFRTSDTPEREPEPPRDQSCTVHPQKVNSNSPNPHKSKTPLIQPTNSQIRYVTNDHLSQMLRLIWNEEFIAEIVFLQWLVERKKT